MAQDFVGMGATPKAGWIVGSVVFNFETMQ
jgi:hypothetical protein